MSSISATGMPTGLEGSRPTAIDSRCAGAAGDFTFGMVIGSGTSIMSLGRSCAATMLVLSSSTMTGAGVVLAVRGGPDAEGVKGNQGESGASANILSMR